MVKIAVVTPIVSLILILVFIGGCLENGEVSKNTTTTTVTITKSQLPTSPINEIPTNSPQNYITVAEVVKPAVVAIEVETSTVDFFGRQITEHSAGSGWIIDPNGLIVTNSHVVHGATKITIILDDGRIFTTIEYRENTSLDLAVIKINTTDLPTLDIGNSDLLKLGEPVAAIGNSLGLGISLKGGWISRLNASLKFEDGLVLQGLIETDAAINPGNSGGPLVNTFGQVIGINSAKLVDINIEGVGYAISINSAMPTINLLVASLTN
jgi:S1-C subfamily serine protease